MIELDSETVFKLQVAINDASRQAVDEFIHQHVHHYEDLDSVRSPGWYVANCHYWAPGQEECGWSTSGSEPVVENSIHEHVLSHDPVGVRIARFHREILSHFQDLSANSQRALDTHLHLQFHIMKDLIRSMAEIGYGLRS